ncbi:MAG: hemolysin III family protein [Actinomycetota bacterium]|nr:hemolysin III family protein [Actinomycetota bacterium]
MSGEVVDAITDRTLRPGQGAARQGDLYDSVRDIYYVKPRLRGWLHVAWFVAAIALGARLIIEAHGTRELTSAAIYVPGVAGLFGVSALYHRGNWGRVWSARLQRADHAMIFLAISATASPAYLVACPGTFGAIGFTVMWVITAVALVGHMVWMDAPEKLVGGAFVTVAAASGLAIPGVWMHAGVAPALLLIAGGVLHGVGAISYQRRSPDPLPTVFGYHEVFHAYGCVAAACQYAAIAMVLR